MMKFRTPKSETRTKPEAPTSEDHRTNDSDFRHCRFGFDSDFEFRISEFAR
jgi:hypothetical protein